VIGFLALPEWRFHKPIGELTSSGPMPPPMRRPLPALRRFR
jgi:hypothetical protein